MATTDYLKEYYEKYDEEGRLDRVHGRVEFLTTIRYIEKYLNPGDKVLEVGAGTGRYTLHLANEGYDVTAVELVDHNLNILKSKIKPEHTITTYQGNAMNLSMLEDNTYDMVVILGPFYHLYTEEDQRKAIEEGLRVTKPGGKIYIAFITHDAVVLSWGLQEQNLVKGIEEGLFNENFECISKPELLFQMFRVDQFKALMVHYPVKEIHTVAADGVSTHFKDILKEKDEKFFNAWLTYHFAVCERQDLMGYSNHVIWIGEKEH